MKLKFDRSYILIAAIALCLIMAACSPSGTNNADALTGAFTDKDLGIAIGGKAYYLREDSAALISALGDGYEYGVTVSTVPVDGKDVTEMITITGGDYATLRGIKIGNTLGEVKAAYGEKWFDDGYLTYSISGDETDIHSERIQFEYSGDTVTRIFIYSPSY